MASSRRRCSRKRRRWVAGVQATTMTQSKYDSAPASYSNGISTISQALSWRRSAANWTHRFRISGCRIASRARRSSSCPKTAARSFARSGIPSGVKTPSPKRARTASWTAGSAARSSCAAWSASKISAGRSTANARARVDLPVPMPPVTPATGTAYLGMSGSSGAGCDASGSGSVSTISSTSSSECTGSPAGLMRRAETKMTRLRFRC